LPPITKIINLSLDSGYFPRTWKIYISFSPNDRAEQLAVVRSMEDCIRDIRLWMLNNDLKLNDDKTEFLIIGTSQQLGKLDNISIRVGDSDIHPLLLSHPSFKSKATLGDRSFTCAAPKLWNELPLDIRSARTVNIFKAKLKTHLFRSAFL
ncbi:unnamed protein product, partial [Pocillopora meandrina]